MVAMDRDEDSISQLEPIPATVTNAIPANPRGKLCEKFLAIKQEGTVAEFRRNFEALTNISREVMEGIFIMG